MRSDHFAIEEGDRRIDVTGKGKLDTRSGADRRVPALPVEDAHQHPAAATTPSSAALGSVDR